MASRIDRIPEEVVNYAQRFHRSIPGDWPSFAVAQWILETGWGEAEGIGGQVWRDGWNGGGIKAARDSRYQTRDPLQGYARYSSPEDYWRDRARILAWYHARARGQGYVPWDILASFDRWWAPDQGYRVKIQQLIVQYRLWRIDPQPSM